jgi:ferrous iron transport protein A
MRGRATRGLTARACGGRLPIENDFQYRSVAGAGPAPMGDVIPLIALRPGQRARLAPPGEGEAIPRRLQDLGFVPDTPIAVVRRAPLGDPVELELRGYRLCLRLAQVTGLRVRLEGAAS